MLDLLPWALAGVAILFTGCGAAWAFLSYRARRLPVTTGREGMIGRRGVARTPLTPTGAVFLDGELWEARSLEVEIEQGATVEVRGVEGLTLLVR